MKKLKVLNLYSGIGGNRKLWEDVEVTAVELNPEISRAYKDFYPNDTVITGDAHDYLLQHFKEFDFIWASPPCPTHSKLVTTNKNKETYALKYPEMSLYQEIILLQNFFEGKWVVENVVSYYDPLIPAHKVGRHYFWSNFNIGNFEEKDKKEIHETSQIPYLQEFLGVDLSPYSMSNKRQVLRNCVLPEHGLYILNCARNIITKQNTSQTSLFDEKL